MHLRKSRVTILQLVLDEEARRNATAGHDRELSGISGHAENDNNSMKINVNGGKIPDSKDSIGYSGIREYLRSELEKQEQKALAKQGNANS